MDRALNQVLAASSPTESAASRFVNASEFCDLMVSHRRMERLHTKEDRFRGLRDLDTGEVFLTDERRLLALRR